MKIILDLTEEQKAMIAKFKPGKTEEKNLTKEQIEVKLIKRSNEIAKAIYNFKIENGRTWKSKLYDVFGNGCNNNTEIGQFRNYYFDLLKKFNNKTSLKEIETAIKNYSIKNEIYLFKF